MKISILIATYGEEQWRDLAMSRALPSALNQGTDGGRWEVHTFHDSEGTIASARNTLAEQVSSDWLCYLDADDELAPGYLDAMKRASEREGAATPLLLTPAVLTIRKGRASRGPVFFDRGIPLTDDNWLVVGTLVERDLFMEVGGFNDYAHGFEDWSLWAKCWKAGAKVVKVPDAIYRYHWNSRSKHKQGWRDRKWQVETHHRVRQELFPELYT